MSAQKYGLPTVETRRMRIVHKIIIPPLAAAGVIIWASREAGRSGKRLGLKLRRPRPAV